jgi:GNAT superfamily N-acetyltransferase
VIEFKALSQLTKKEIEVVATSVSQLDPSFYLQLSSDKSECIEKICRVITTNGTDLCTGDAAFLDGDFVGYSCYFPTKEKKFRSASAMKMLLDNEPVSEKRKIITLATEFSKGIAPLETSGLYLNKIHAFRGKVGIGTVLLERFIEQARLDNVPCCLHVKKDNKQAILFYKSNGFEMHSSGYEYNFMIRDCV